jgi:malate dehydrogenase (quinone)|tara:strand:- start:248 stop:1753 length:1506 start_codon:yes stop_codon:yes gene_type:complete
MNNNEIDVLLIGGGIMSATLGVLLHQLNPNLRMTMVEKLSALALESSDAMNNAGTGHAGYCELNYTPQAADGSVAIDRALDINADFETSLQLWSSLVEMGALPAPEHFIRKTPHLSFVWDVDGSGDNLSFLKERHTKLQQHHLFKEMQFSDDFAQLRAWMPLMMQDRDAGTPMAATYVDHGADVDFGVITRHLVDYLKQQPNFSLLTDTSVKSMEKVKQPIEDKSWHIALTNKVSKRSQTVDAKFVFIGAGGGTLPLLQKANIEESLGYGGFPVSGQWLVCNNPDVIKQHYAKVYGKAAVGAPPMSMPHLDTRIIDGNPQLLFGPFAGFTTKFLKAGSKMDLPKSIQIDNVKAMLGVGKNNIDLTKYLIKEATQTHEQRMDALRSFLPQANSKDWQLEKAGQRVQVIKSCEDNWGKLEFGTEIVSAKDGSLAALLGASPGASVSVKAMLDVIECCFTKQITQRDWQAKLTALMPAYGKSLVNDAELLNRVRKHTHTVLKLY